MGLADWFNTFCKNIQVQDGGTISSRYKSITRRLNTDFWNTTSDTSHSLYVGSYGRNTAIQGFSDLDMIFQLPSSVYQQYNKLRREWTICSSSSRKELYREYISHFGKSVPMVRLLKLHSGTGSRSKSFLLSSIPIIVSHIQILTLGGVGRFTNPKPEINAIRTRNNACNGNLVPLCRMMRAWKSKWSVPIGGLLVDTLAYQFINDWQYRHKSYFYYNFMCRDFFKFMADQDKNQEYWKAPGSGQYVYGKGLFQSKAQKCHNLSLSAIVHETANREWSAKQEWRKIFGTSFPN